MGTDWAAIAAVQNLDGTTTPGEKAGPAVLYMKAMGNATGLDAGDGVVVPCRFSGPGIPRSDPGTLPSAVRWRAVWHLAAKG
jgi:hypothetical protein